MNLLCLFLFLFSVSTMAQFPPPAGQVGTTAISADSSVFIAWATDIEVERGYQDITNPDLGLTTVGEPNSALGIADATNIISLGDGGSATLTFEYPIRNGEGFDFAVFENAFDDTFLELAFVEVSSDGSNFVRFPATSNTPSDNQMGTFGWTDATLINNLAGKYRVLFGTPFDLAELIDSTLVDVNSITHVRIIDVIGSIEEAYATYDQYGNAVNNPFPTPFPSSGFDLDAVGVIHNVNPNSIEALDAKQESFVVFPNPIQNGEELNLSSNGDLHFMHTEIYNSNGKQVISVFNQSRIQIQNLLTGFYIVKTKTNKGVFLSKLAVK